MASCMSEETAAECCLALNRKYKIFKDYIITVLQFNVVDALAGTRYTSTKIRCSFYQK